MSRRAALNLVSLLVALAAAAAVAVGVTADEVDPGVPRPAVDRPDVVLVIGCTVRADQMTPYGGPADTTPYLQQLSTEGTRFAQTIAQAPWTRPSVSALLTGRHPASVGISDPDGGRNDRIIGPDVTLLAEVFRDAGYRTVGLTANSNLNSLFGFDQGFDEYLEYSPPWRLGVVKTDGSLVVADALEHVDRSNASADPRPLFLQLVLVDTHLPNKATRREVAAFAEPDLSRRIVRYRAMLRRFDDAVEQLALGLERRGHDRSNTYLVVVADHGEGLEHPFHHGNAHGRFLYPSAVQLAWILRGPEVPAGHVVTGLSAGIDLMPTLLGLADVQAPEVPGLDLSGTIRERSTETGRFRAYTATWFRSLTRAAVYTPQRTCQRDYHPEATAREVARFERRKRGLAGFEDGCFDRAGDPLGEDLFTDPALQDELDRWRQALVVEARDAEVLRADIDADLAGRLEALGYLE